jgi:hypothetical protein
MRVTRRTRDEVMTGGDVRHVLDELDRLQSEIGVRIAVIRALHPRPAFVAPAWFQELL